MTSIQIYIYVVKTAITSVIFYTITTLSKQPYTAVTVALRYGVICTRSSMASKRDNGISLWICSTLL